MHSIDATDCYRQKKWHDVHVCVLGKQVNKPYINTQTAEPIKMLVRGISIRLLWAQNHVLDGIGRCSSAASDKYDGSIFVKVAMQPVATITAATCYYCHYLMLGT